MSGKLECTTEEWVQLIEVTLLASLAVTAAAPSGRWGVLQGAFAARPVLLAQEQDKRH